MAEIDLNDLVTRLLLFAEGSRRRCRQEKNADEALIDGNSAMVLEDAAKHIEAHRDERDRLKSINAELLGALKFIMAFYEPGQRYLDTEAWKVAEAGARAAVERATEKDEEAP